MITHTHNMYIYILINYKLQYYISTCLHTYPIADSPVRLSESSGCVWATPHDLFEPPSIRIIDCILSWYPWWYSCKFTSHLVIIEAHWSNEQWTSMSNWLVVSTPLKNISRLGWLFPIYTVYGNIKFMFQTTNRTMSCIITESVMHPPFQRIAMKSRLHAHDMWDLHVCCLGSACVASHEKMKRCPLNLRTSKTTFWSLNNGDSTTGKGI